MPGFDLTFRPPKSLSHDVRLHDLDRLIAEARRELSAGAGRDQDALRKLRGLQGQRCEIIGHEFSMIYNDGSTCLNCGMHR